MWQARAFRVALRIAVIEAWHWRQTPKKIQRPRLSPIVVPDQETVRRALLQAQAGAGHALEKRGEKLVTCRRCRRSAGRLNAAAWLTPCEGRAAQIIKDDRTQRSHNKPVSAERAETLFFDISSGGEGGVKRRTDGSIRPDTLGVERVARRRKEQPERNKKGGRQPRAGKRRPKRARERARGQKMQMDEGNRRENAGHNNEALL